MKFESRLAQYKFEKFILEIAISTLEHGGGAFAPGSFQVLPPVDAWSFPKYPGLTAILPPECDLVEELKKFISSNESYLKEPGSYLGTWINPQTQHFYLDITIHRVDLREAVNMAVEIGQREGRKIVALYNSSRNETFYL